MASPNSRVRNARFYGDQLQSGLTRGLHTSQRDIRAASAYPVAARASNNPERGIDADNQESSSARHQQLEPSHQQYAAETLSHSNSYSSGSWEDDVVEESQYFGGDEPGVEVSEDAEQDSDRNSFDEQIDSVLELWQRGSSSPAEGNPASGVESFPPYNPEPNQQQIGEADLHDSALPELDAAPTSSFSFDAPKTPPRLASPSDTIHLTEYSPNLPAPRASFPGSPPVYRHQALRHQPSYNYSPLPNQSFEDPYNPPQDLYQIRFDNQLPPPSERRPFLDFSSPNQSFGSENQSFESQRNSRSRFRKSSKSFPKPRNRENSLPSAHDFQTLDGKNRFDPLNYFPERESRGPIRSPPVFNSPPPERFPKAPPFQFSEPEPPAPQAYIVPDDKAFSVPYSELPVEPGPVKRKHRRSLRLAASLKKIFIPKHRNSKEYSSPVTSPGAVTSPQLPQIRLNDAPFSPDEWDALVKAHEAREVQERAVQAEIYRRAMMDPRHLDPSSAVVALTKQKSEAMRLAREQGAAVHEMCRRAKSDVPPYRFEELIGKGAYGRVYKGRQLRSNALVAIKVLEIDTLDYKSGRDFKDESIKDFIKEINVMKQAKDAGAKNINMLVEAVSIHSQLWLVCEYCPGGSVKTLMRATGDKLQEKFIIPIARELAEGLKAIHNAGILHRDVKAANVLIHEEGRLQICDFGVSGILQSKTDKRSTWVGTPHWMPPEMFSIKNGGVYEYGSEVDVWAYGCTLIECATGNPPNSNLRERMQIGMQLNRFPPKLEGDTYSDVLRSLVAFALEVDPKTRPSMQEVLQHRYIANTKESHPTSSLSELVKIYYQWLQRGGQRISLFNPGGAAAAEYPDEQDPLDREDWNFSTTAGFEKRFSLIDLDQISASLVDFEKDMTPTLPEPTGDSFDEGHETELTSEDKVNFNRRVERGAAAMEGLFDEEKPDYKYETKNDFVPVQQEQRFSSSSDLPLRTDTDRSSVTSTLIDINLGVYDSAHYAAGSSNPPPFQLADADTIRANRSSSRSIRNSAASSDSGDYQPPRGPRPPTMEWTFASAMATTATDDNNQVDENGPNYEPRQREKRDTRAWTFPVMTPEEDPVPEEPEDDVMARHYPPLERPVRDDGPPDSRPSTATSSHSAVSDADNDPFRFDRPVTPSGEDADHRASFDKFPSITDSEPYPDYEASSRYPHLGAPYQEDGAGRNGSYTGPGPSALEHGEQDTQSVDAGADMDQLDFPHPVPPSMESLMEGASDETVAQELDRLLGDFLHGLAVTGEALVRTDVGRGGVSGNNAGAGNHLQQGQDD
ncbi:STE/STE20/YSK protein kinase [Helicocarpus griseus UAMH5409]|uniref:non-specific serine/threonine protein kinase n=1 Tax=Helicocarpus griseus UAMH5409 TaxID=1447875 RepID=A0A2B7Y9H4_9EURO|nr:STE/STE20/YSK protein kinase [Helicocarpus griseus UAMH5409]